METEPILSFCIRSLHPDIREQDIRSSLDNVFNISKIDFVNKNTRPIYSNCRNCFKMAFIHVESWNKLFSTVLRDNILCDIRSDDGLKIYYKDFKYFVLRENLNPIFKRESRIKELEKENAELYKEIFRLKSQFDEPSISKWIHHIPDAKVPIKKRLKKKKNQKLDKDIEDYLYITTAEEDNNIHMNVSLIDEV
jgi:hypothetical protein